MHLVCLIALYLSLNVPAETLNLKRQKFFGRSVGEENSQDLESFRANESSTSCPPTQEKKTTKLRRAPPVFQGPTNSRQTAVVGAFQHAWQGYKKYAWGHDELKPVSKSFENPFELGLTIVDSLDTAIIMGLEEETREAIEWIEGMNVSPDRSVNVFETTIRVLGGLLSGYHLTGENVLLEKAIGLGDNLLAAFSKSSSPIPKSDVNLKTGDAFSPYREYSSLAEATTLQLEFRDLTMLTGEKKYEDVSFGASEHVHKDGCNEIKGLCPFYMNNKGDFQKTTITLGARADSYYEYLIKQWLQTKKSIDWLRDDFTKAMDSVRKNLYKASSPNGVHFIGEIRSDEVFYPKMDHLVCFLAGSLVLSHQNGLDTNGEHLEMAKELGEVCHKMYENPTGLGPEIIHINMENTNETTMEDIYIKKADSHSLLRPEAIEAWFYLYRATNDKKYQEWGWSAFQAIEKYAKVESGGYSSIESVLKKKVQRRDKMESFFTAETLKYLYLLLADDQSILPFDRWIFNTEAHPFPIYN